MSRQENAIKELFCINGADYIEKDIYGIGLYLNKHYCAYELDILNAVFDIFS